MENRPPDTANRITVIGAGIVGICCALTLQREGRRVTLMDRLPPGEGTSYGNAGLIQVGACVPMATQGVLARVPRMLLDPDGPLIIRWRYLARIAPWLARFVAAASPSRVEGISIALAALLDQADDAYAPLIASSGADDLFRPTGELHVYRRESAFRIAMEHYDLRRRRGVKLDFLDGDELRQLEPALSPDIKRGVMIPDCRLVIDPLSLSQRLAHRFVADGGEILLEEVEDIELGPSGPRAVVIKGGRRDVDELVLAAGAYSRPWAKKLGAGVPLDTERGYHLMLPEPGVDLRTPLLAGDHRFAIIPMQKGLRLAGTSELAGLHAPPYYGRADMLARLADRYVPGINARGGVQWMGYRPSMPDSLPVIGRSPRCPNVYFAFGHGHLGLTLGAITGRLVADMAAGRDPQVDLSPYRPGRFFNWHFRSPEHG